MDRRIGWVEWDSLNLKDYYVAHYGGPNTPAMSLECLNELPNGVLTSSTALHAHQFFFFFLYSFFIVESLDRAFQIVQSSYD